MVRGAWFRYRLRPRVLRDVTTVDLSTSILGGRMTLQGPVCVAGFAGGRAVHEDGEIAAVTAATTAGVVYVPACLVFGMLEHLPANLGEHVLCIAC